MYIGWKEKVFVFQSLVPLRTPPVKRLILRPLKHGAPVGPVLWDAPAVAPKILRPVGRRERLAALAEFHNGVALVSSGQVRGIRKTLVISGQALPPHMVERANPRRMDLRVAARHPAVRRLYVPLMILLAAFLCRQLPTGEIAAETMRWRLICRAGARLDTGGGPVDQSRRASSAQREATATARMCVTIAS